MIHESNSRGIYTEMFINSHTLNTTTRNMLQFIFNLLQNIQFHRSFYRGKVHTALKGSVFQPSSPLRHATEMTQILEGNEKPMKEVLLLFSDGGPDHTVNYLLVTHCLISEV